MSIRSNVTNVSYTQSIGPDARTAGVNGTGVDTREADSATVLFDIGAYTAGEFTFDIEESDDDAVYTSVASTDLIGSLPTIGGSGDADQVVAVGYIGTSRYIRAVAATGSPTGNAVFGATVELSHLHQK